MKYVIIIAIMLLPGIVSSQQSLNDKLSATVDRQYETMTSPISINYKVYPYGGSGNYDYRWRTKGEKFTEFSSIDTFQQSFDCSSKEQPRIKVICQIKDIETGKILTVQTTHPVEFCLD